MSGRPHEQEEGVALITALLAVIILAGLSVIFTNRAIVETRTSGFSQNFESTIHTAESAADRQIAAMNLDDRHITDLGTTVGRLTLSQQQLDDPAWVDELLEDHLATIRESEAYVADGQGEAFAVRPSTGTSDDDGEVPWDVIYTIGATPSFESPRATVRTVKLQLAQDNFVPEYAILTDGDLRMGGNASIEHPECTADPDTCIADVHVNGTVSSSGQPIIQGRVTVAGGTCSNLNVANIAGGCVGTGGGVQPQPIPPFHPRDFYNRPNSQVNPDPTGQSVEQFDLCPGAVVRSPGATPCTGAQIWPDPDDPADPSTFRGWQWQANQWRATSLQAGIFYVYEADAVVQGTEGAEQRAVTILVDGGNAPKSSSGSLRIPANSRLQAGLSGVLAVTERDFHITGTGGGGPESASQPCTSSTINFSGFIGVGEQFRAQGTARLKGAVVVQDLEDAHGWASPPNDGVQGNMCLEYDDDLSVDLTGIWVVTFWNEV